jgi:cyclopropane fatty-acyl-phospholipid synthase-like methyltransferase
MADALSKSAGFDEPWERFAETDPYSYILTDLKDGNLDEFWQSGRQVVNREILPLIQSRGISRGIALELGCGVGRLALPLASSFQEIWGVDIAEAMVRRARVLASDQRVRNAHFCAISGPADLGQQMREYLGRVDFLYSLLVFQHISDFSVIAAYLGVIGSLLADTGTAYLQFDSRPQSLAYHLKSKLPDFLLPRFWRKGIRRIRRSPRQLEESLQEAGLKIAGQRSPSSDYHRYILARDIGARS